MSDDAARVNELASAYRAAMRAGDTAFAHDRVQRQVLQAIVLDSASRAELWVKTRLSDSAARPLAELTPALAHGNLVGQGLQRARDEAVRQAKSAVTWLVLGGTTPALIGAVLAFFGGLFGFSQDAGLAIGEAAIPALLAGGPIVYAAFRLLQASPQIVEAGSGAASSALASAEAIGGRAESLFAEHVRPALQRLGPVGYQPAAVSPVLTQLRGGAKGILVSAYVILGLCVIFFCFGIGDAYQAYQEQQVDCLRLSDGSCLGD